MEKKERLTLFLCQAKGEHSRLEPQELCPCLTPGECVCVRTLVHTRTCTPTHTQLHLTLCNPMDSSSRGSSVHGILQTRILEWVAIPFSRGSSQPRDQVCVSCIAGDVFTTGPPGKPTPGE